MYYLLDSPLVLYEMIPPDLSLFVIHVQCKASILVVSGSISASTPAYPQLPPHHGTNPLTNSCTRRSLKRLRPVIVDGGRSTRGKLRLTLLNHRFRAQTLGEYTLNYASPTIFPRFAFYLVMAPIDVCYVAISSEAI